MENDILIIEEGTKRIKEFAFAQNNTFSRVEFPESLEAIGPHAFYNCKNLKSIHFKNCDTDIGNGVFKNCHKLNNISINKYGNNLKSLKAILLDLNQELNVNILYKDGEARLIFPYGIENYEDYSAARVTIHVMEGAGLMYRECLGFGDIDYVAYDDIFKMGLNLDIYNASLMIAINRLNYPYKLLKPAKETYISYIKKNYEDIFKELIENNNLKMTKALLALNILDRKEEDELITKAREVGKLDFLSILLDHYGEKHERKGKAKYTF